MQLMDDIPKDLPIMFGLFACAIVGYLMTNRLKRTVCKCSDKAAKLDKLEDLSERSSAEFDAPEALRRPKNQDQLKQRRAAAPTPSPPQEILLAEKTKRASERVVRMLAKKAERKLRKARALEVQSEHHTPPTGCQEQLIVEEALQAADQGTEDDEQWPEEHQRPEENPSELTTPEQSCWPSDQEQDKHAQAKFEAWQTAEKHKRLHFEDGEDTSETDEQWPYTDTASSRWEESSNGEPSTCSPRPQWRWQTGWFSDEKWWGRKCLPAHPVGDDWMTPFDELIGGFSFVVNSSVEVQELPQIHNSPLSAICIWKQGMAGDAPWCNDPHKSADSGYVYTNGDHVFKSVPSANGQSLFTDGKQLYASVCVMLAQTGAMEDLSCWGNHGSVPAQQGSVSDHFCLIPDSDDEGYSSSCDWI